MGLVNQAIQDARRIMTDLNGFGIALEFTKPDGSDTVTISGRATSHFLTVDGDGAPAIGKQVSCTVNESVLSEAGFQTRNTAGEVALTGCRVSWTDATGASRTYKITHHQPDNTLGLIVCFCKDYQ